MSIIRNPALAPEGRKKIAWAQRFMPALEEIFEKVLIPKQAFDGVKIGMAIHLEAKTAQLAIYLRRAGARVFAAGCNPLSTQDDVAAALAEYDGIEVYAKHDCNEKEYINFLYSVLANGPELTIDDGGDLIAAYREAFCNKDAYSHLIGGCEETTTGIHRLKALEFLGELPVPMMDVNDADCKHLFDNRYGTGQSVLTAIMATTNVLIAGKTFVVAGYGWCGRGVALRAAGMGANVIVTEVDPVRAMEAKMDGFRVMTMDEAAPIGDFFVTVTGFDSVITGEHYKRMKHNAFLANAGHFDVELNLRELRKLSVDEPVESRKNILTYMLENGNELHLLAEGRLVNLAAGDGHPAEIMDMSFALQALGLEYVLRHQRSNTKLENKLYRIPREIDERVAWAKLRTMSVEIDDLCK